ncbi:rod shape-determining protein MreC [Acetobacter sp. AN02]|uniref:rod shape-determining protein MreC n=1 Tax=Acetobacter sp. AN02 TaxID=2894186 RepID=UPI0024344049|nr:rod shape-determining protein MreC [Acetobacter sp. AN02]MDG6094325.1 rod shape-determining protein MreC [Acetobacter sp. AN02]
MIRLSIQNRQALEKLVLPLTILVAIATILLGQADRKLADKGRMLFADLMTPFRSLTAQPGMVLSDAGQQLRGAVRLAGENAALRAENEKLRGWYDVALSLAQENQTLKHNLHWMPDPAPSFVTGRVVADAGGVYGHAVLIGAGPSSGIRLGNIALAADGFAGRVTEVGEHSARVLLIDDVASRIPVTMEKSGTSAIMTGDRSPTPRLMYYPQDHYPAEGERVVTGGQISLLPAGLPVGTVHYLRPGQPVVVPYAHLDHIRILRIFNFGTTTIEPPDAPGRIPYIPSPRTGPSLRAGMPPGPFAPAGGG